MKVIIIGIGKLGYKLAQSLLNSDINVTVVDSNAKKLERMSEQLDVFSINANGIEVEILREFDIDTYDLLIASTGSDETNAVICMMAKKLGCKRTIARIRNPEYTKQLEFLKKEMGIDYIVNPDLAIAQEIAHYLLKGYTFHAGDFANGKVQIIDFNVGHLDGFVGKKVFEIDFLEGLLIASISRKGNIIIPDGSTRIEAEDLIYIIGRNVNIKRFSEATGINTTRQNIRKVMVLGGGNIGFYLAKLLTNAKVDVTVIDQDADRCQYLTEKVNDALVIHGDGTDINILEDEFLSSMDAFIGVTGFDEQNILTSLMAKQAGVEKVIAKISRPSYSRLLDRLGVDVALNPVNIVSSDILKYVRGGRILSVFLLMGEQAEVMEVVVESDSPMVDKRIVDLHLPKGILIGAVIQDNEVVIPNGNTVIRQGDQLIAFCLVANVQEFENLLQPKKGGFLSALRNRR